MMSPDHDLTIDQLRDVVQDSHLNFLIGAGASSEEFSTLAGVEQTLAEVAASDPDLPTRTQARAAVYAHYFRGVISRNRGLLGGSRSTMPILESYCSFLETLNRLLLRRRSSILNKQINLFTTNIDVATECAAEELHLELNDGFTGRLAPRFSTANFGSVRFRRSLQYDNLSEMPTFNLLKLHGSVGWATRSHTLDSGEVRGEIRADTHLALIDEIDAALLDDALRVLPFDGSTEAAALLVQSQDASGGPLPERFLETYERLAIVNPEKEKFRQTVLNQNYYDLLRIFSNDLEKENSVLFTIGFSCRDEHIRELIVRSAQTNPTLQVYIFAHSPAGIADIEDRFANYQTTNGNIRVAGPPAATDGAAQAYYTLRHITRTFFDPLVPAPPRRPDAIVDVNVNVEPPAAATND